MDEIIICHKHGVAMTPAPDVSDYGRSPSHYYCPECKKSYPRETAEAMNGKR